MRHSSKDTRAGERQHDELLGLVGQELGALAAETQALQTALSHALVEAARQDSRMVGSLQALDRIEQTLSNLSRLMAGLQRQGQAVHPHAAQDALGEVAMADLRRRLGCLILARTSGSAPCDVEFFASL